MNDLADWIKAFITQFRNESTKLSEDERARISNLDDFSAPCQVLVLSFPDAKFQSLICTHDESREDMEMEVADHIRLYETVDKMESILKDPKWSRKLSNEGIERIYGPTTFSEILEDIFAGIAYEIRNVSFREPPKTNAVEFKLILPLRDFQWTIRGNIAEMDSLKMVNEIIEQAKKNYASAKVAPASVSQPKPVIKGHITFFYPRIWIGKLPKKTFREKVFGAYRFPQKALDLEYKGKLMIINQDGLIAIGEESAKKATRMFNEIMATFLLAGIEANAVRELEVGDAGIDPSTKTLTSWTSWGTMVNRPRIPFSLEPLPWFPVFEVEKEQILNVIQQAELFSKDPDISDFLIFFLEADTHFKNSEYAQSFIMSWVIIERHMLWLWKKFLKEKGITRERRGKLTNPAVWSIDFILEGLSLGEQLTIDEYHELISLKNRRNDFVHEGESITLEESKKCLEIAKSIVRQKSGILVHPDSAHRE